MLIIVYTKRDTDDVYLLGAWPSCEVAKAPIALLPCLIGGQAAKPPSSYNYEVIAHNMYMMHRMTWRGLRSGVSDPRVRKEEMEHELFGLLDQTVLLLPAHLNN